MITLSASGLPAGATFPGSSSAGSVSSTLTWPDAGPGGAQAITFAASGTGGVTYETIVFYVQGEKLSVATVSVLNVDFQPGVGGDTHSVTYSGQGALADAGNDLWNAVAPPTPIDATNTATISGGQYTNEFVVGGAGKFRWYGFG
ncbi:hypothetical protein PDESU_00974 [Pontiella desulfatans]|uniref:Uncharacterized protein n=2 Tax=Pontiella desulfatans TaxID=2750659 RepID=A0A6C2TXT4_PONDE|nr:hypothetical protein PDESU_00974 [Pontiella desulfatans]